MRAQSRPGKRARINLLCRMHACRWTLFVREKKTSFVVKAQRVRFVVLFIIIMRTTTRETFCFSFFPLFSRRRKKANSKAKAKGEIVWGRRILLLFSLDAIPRIDLTDLSLSLSLSFGTKLFGREEEEEEEEERDDDAGRRPLPRFRHRADGESRGDQEGV